MIPGNAFGNSGGFIRCCYARWRIVEALRRTKCFSRLLERGIMEKTVSIAYYDNYEAENVERAVKRIFDSFGGIS